MRRSPLQRRKPMKRGKGFRRPKSVWDTKAHRRAFDSPEFVDFIHSLGCCVPGCYRTDIEAAHVLPRSRGGRWWDVVPLCGPHHRRQEKRTEQFNAEFGIDLENIAHATALRWKAATYTSEE